MEFLRKLFGRSTQDVARGRIAGRSAHVTPSQTQRVEMPVSEDRHPPQSEAEVETEAPLDPPSADEDEAAELAHQDSASAAASDQETVVEAPAPEQKPAAEPPARSSAPTQIPAPKPILTRQRQSLTYGIASDVGIVRDNNEDACFGMQWQSITVDNRPDFGLFIVADGMGGHLDGERASGVAVQTLAATLLESIYVPMLKNFKAGNSPTIMEALVSASEKANRAVIKRVPGGGTTLSAVAIVGNLAYLVHVGDSRAYLMHENKIEQLTTDHTLVQRLIAMQELTEEEAENYPQKNVLYRAIGQNEKLKLERLIRTLPSGGQVLLCTDGLWDVLDDDTIRDVSTDADSPQEACDRLVRIANERGASDNITVIIFRLPRH